MVTKQSKLYPAVRIFQSMVDYYKPDFSEYLVKSECDFITFYELQKNSTDKELSYVHLFTQLHSSHYEEINRLRRFFYDVKAIKIDTYTLLYLSIMDNLFDSYFNDFSFSIVDFYYYIDIKLIYLKFPFLSCVSDNYTGKSNLRPVL